MPIGITQVWSLILCVNLGGPWYPDILSNIITTVSVRFCLNEINI